LKNRIAVLGIGSSGVQSLCHLCSNLDQSWEVVSIYSPDIPILGIGESSNPAFISTLEDGLNISVFNKEDLNALNATIKLGTQYSKWRKHDFINPLIGGTLAIHFDTFNLKTFALPKLKQVWGSKFNILEGEITKIDNLKEAAIVHLKGGVTESFDFIIDCRGTPDSFENTYTAPTPLLNTCLVHNTKPDSTTELEFTGHIATPHGWMFRVPLKSRTSYGYLFNSSINTESEAIKGLSKSIGVPTKELSIKSFEFTPYYSNKIIDNRIILNGNRAAFFEPMFGNSLWIYNIINHMALDFIYGVRTDEEINKDFIDVSEVIRSTIAFHYLEGTTFDSAFWSIAEKWSKEALLNNDKFWGHIDTLNNRAKTNAGWAGLPSWAFSARSFQQISRNLNYKYI
jgi:tryptophan 7-halogenase